MATPKHQLSVITAPSVTASPVYDKDSRPLPSFINRDLSLLEFFRSVLEEAADTSLPLLDRLKFIAIYASNIDEFFSIRVSGLKEKYDDQFVSRDGYTRSSLLPEIREKVLALNKLHSGVLRNEVFPDLAKEGIALEPYADVSADVKAELDTFFDEQIYPVLTPQAVDPTHPFPYISAENINIGLFIKPKLVKRVQKRFAKIGDEFFARIEIPSFLPRMVPIRGEETRFVMIEEIVCGNIHKIAPDAKSADCHFFRLTRDGDIDIRETEAQDLLETMEENLKERRFGQVVRLEVSSKMPSVMVDHLIDSLEIEHADMYRSEAPLKLTDLWSLVEINRPDLKEATIRTRQVDQLRSGEPIFEVIKHGDVLLHHPYNPYRTVTDMIREAADDPDVLAIKMCLYRIGENSPIAPLLIRASENGKQVTALIEIKARFDEANNIVWAKRLEEAGVHVVYGVLGLKTHAKTTLIVRREDGGLRRYVHLATGNYNPATSTVYTDLGLLTADESIGADVADIFNYLTVYTEPKEFRTLLMAPLNLRERMMELIDRETENAKRGRRARIVAKINRLADAEIVNKLYEASQAGVTVDLIVRGVCTLRPGVPGLSENITVRSIVGRLLEHSRVYYFENDGNEEVYIGSSDWMPRNLDRRVEVLSPVKDRRIARYLIDEYLTAYLSDNVKARILQPDGSYTRVEVTGEPLDAQLSFQARPNTFEFSH